MGTEVITIDAELEAWLDPPTADEHTSPADVRAARYSEEDGTQDVAGEALKNDMAI